MRVGVEYRHYIDDYYSRNRYRGTITLPSMADFLIGRAGTPLAQGGNGSGTSNLSATEVGTGIPDVAANEDAADGTVNLRSFFDDTQDGAAGLTYTVQTNSNPGLFTSTFALSIRPGQDWNLPGAPFFLAAALLGLAIPLTWAFTRPRPGPD